MRSTTHTPRVASAAAGNLLGGTIDYCSLDMSLSSLHHSSLVLSLPCCTLITRMGGHPPPPPRPTASILRPITLRFDGRIIAWLARGRPGGNWMHLPLHAGQTEDAADGCGIYLRQATLSVPGGSLLVLVE